MLWFRMWAEAVDDEKLRLLAFEDRWHFVALLCLKAKGVLDEPDEELKRRKIGIKLGLNSQDLETAMKRLVTVGLVSTVWEPISWNKRQFSSDSSTSRVRKFRERHRNVSVTPSDNRLQKQITETDTKKPPRERGCRVPEPFEITPEMREWARAKTPNVANLDEATEEFVDYWRGVSGRNGVRSDWIGTWRNRLRELDKRAGRTPKRSEGKSEWM